MGSCGFQGRSLSFLMPLFLAGFCVLFMVSVAGDRCAHEIA